MNQVAAVQRALATFDVRPDDGGVDASKSYPHSYWRKPGNGELCIQPAWATEFMYLVQRGYTQLSRFGTFYPKNPDGWDTQREPWRRIFQMGGAEEFSVEQILEQGWHRKPPYADVVFPQIKQLEPGAWQIMVGERRGEIVRDIVCPTCKRLFLKPEHLTNHETIAHKETSANAAMGRAIADAQIKGIEQMSGPLADVVRSLAEQQAQTSATLQQQGAVLTALLERLTAPAAAEPAPAPSKKAA